MKPSLFYVSFVLFIFGIDIAPSTQAVVKDADGRLIENGSPCYLGPVTAANGGGLKLAKVINNKPICPYHVVQDPSPDNLGDMFMVILVVKHEGYLYTGGVVGIYSGYERSGPCQQLPFWAIPDAEANAPDNLVITGGDIRENVSCFRVVEHPKPTNPKVPSYLIQHCPSLCGFGPQTCFNLSIYEYNGVRRLASRGTPFEFVFRSVPISMASQ